MNKKRIKEILLILALAAAAGAYLERGPGFRGSADPIALSESEVAKLLHEPRSLPDIAFSGDDGRATRLSNFRGKVILLNIWATWCVPCRKEMAALDRLQASLGGSDFEVVALSVDREGLPAVRAFYQQTGISQLRLYAGDSGPVLSELGIPAIPTTLLIDRNGSQIGIKVGAAMWDSPALANMIRGRLQASARPPEPLISQDAAR